MSSGISVGPRTSAFGQTTNVVSRRTGAGAARTAHVRFGGPARVGFRTAIGALLTSAEVRFQVASSCRLLARLGSEQVANSVPGLRPSPNGFLPVGGPVTSGSGDLG